MNTRQFDFPIPLRATSRFSPALLPLVVGLLTCATTPSYGWDGLTFEQEALVERYTRKEPSHGGPPILTKSSAIRPAATPMPLKRAEAPPAIAWQLDGNTLTLDDYFKRQPVMALLIAKDGVIQYERYQFGRTAQHHYLSNSIAKSFTGLAMGFAQAEGNIPSFEALAQTYVPQMQGTAYGETTLRNLMRMGSGVKFSENSVDHSSFVRVIHATGIVRAASMFNNREAPQGSRFIYASAETAVLSAVLQAATGENVASYLEPRLWQAMGAEGEARWMQDDTGLTVTYCCLTALPHDYLRLGIVLANDGARPDTGKQIIPREFLIDGTDWHKADEPFRPRPGSRGYGHLFWLLGGQARRFAMLGVNGQAVFIDPGNKLVMVHFAAYLENPEAGRKRTALWRGVVQHYGTP